MALICPEIQEKTEGRCLMTSYEQKEILSNDADPEMLSVLEKMLEADETITARAVARRHPTIKHASSFTRHPARSDLLSRYQEQQKRVRNLARRIPKRSKAQIANQLAEKDMLISELVLDRDALRCFILAMIQAVGEAGGTPRLAKFYADYRAVRDRLGKLGVLPQAEVKHFKSRHLAGAEDATA